ncbi:MAG: FAD-binding protein [Rickettsiales bacterium]
MTVLIIAEHDNKELAASTLSVVTAANAIGGGFDVLVAGVGAESVSKQAVKINGAGKVLYSDASHYAYPLAENIAPLIVSIAGNYSHVLMAATTTGKDIMPRIAALLGVSQISEIVEVLSADTFVRPIYAGNALETVRSNEDIKIITVRTTAFAKAEMGGSTTIETLAPLESSNLSSFVELNENKSERPELTSARIVVSGGRGLGSAENFKKLEGFADKLKAGVGASRAAVDAGFVPNDYQVGQTGKVVAPELYIAVGISGAIQHLAGMKDSKVIVAINKDENAPIFEIADYGLVAGWEEALPELEKLLSE